MTKALLKNSKYNPLTEEEWTRFFSLIDMSQVPEQHRQRIFDMFKASGRNDPIVRKFIREQTAPFVISQTDEDMYLLEAASCFAYAQNGTITWHRDATQIPSSAIHEMRHIQQEKNNLWMSDTSRELSIIGNKLQEAECATLSAHLDGVEIPYVNKLLAENERLIKQDLKETDIPYADGLTKQEKIQAKKLYIHEQAMQKTMGQSIALLMQKNTADTMALASSFGVDLSHKDLNSILKWRMFYKEQAIKDAIYQHTIQEAGLSNQERKEAERVYQFMCEQYPILKKYSFFQTGFSRKEALEVDIVHSKGKELYTTYFDGTDKVLSERVLEEGLLVTKVYRNDEAHSLSTQVFEDASGKHRKEIFYDRQGNPTREMIYENDELIASQGYFENNAPIKGAVRWKDIYKGGKYQKTQFLDKEGQVLDTQVLSYDESNNQTIDIKEYDNSVFKRRIDKKKEKGIYREIQYVDGSSRKGYVSDANAPVGEWIYTDPQGNVTKEFYSGKLIKDDGRPSKEGVQIRNPLIELKKQGYIKASEIKNVEFKKHLDLLKKQKLVDKNVTLENFYVKKAGDGVDFACLTTHGVMCVSGSYQTDKKDQKIIQTGEWKEYNRYGEKERKILFDNKGKMLSSIKTEGSTGRVIEEEYNTTRQSLLLKYDANGRVLKRSTYDPTNQSESELYEEHVNGRNVVVQLENEYLYYDYNGNLTSVEYPDGSGVFFYVEDGVKDPEKAKKEKIILLDEKGNQKIVQYRKDGTLLSVAEVDEKGKGYQTFYAPDGRTKMSEGNLKNFKKTGEWSYYKGNLTRKVQYEDNKIVSGGELHVSDFDAQYEMRKMAERKPAVQPSADASARLSQNSSKVDGVDEQSVTIVSRSTKGEGR